MKGSELKKKIERLGRRNRIEVAWDPKRGKGSHGTIHYGTRKATLKDLKKEYSKGLIKAILTQLGIDPKEIN